jgi:transposase
MKKSIEMKIVNPHAAGIDVGSREHLVAVGQDLSDVSKFDISHSGHLSLVALLKLHKIQTVAMESTGSYWQSLYLVLIEAGFEVLLVPGSQTKTYLKSDVKDARHIQQLHSLGLLSSCYLPNEFTLKLRELSRHRKSMVQDASKYINRMQKCLRMMNLRLDVVINDIVGISGIRIIRAILAGERDPISLAALAHGRIKKTKEQIADALYGNYQDEFLYELKDNFELFEGIQNKLHSLDIKIETLMTQAVEHIQLPKDLILAKKQLKGKNQPKIKLQELSYKFFNIDLSAITGISVNTILSFISEVGTSIDKFRNAKAFTSWLRLSPNNKVSGGKVLSSRTPKGKNPLAIAFRDAANVIGNQKSGELTTFFKRIGLKKGRGAAITATARKIAVIFYNMVTKKQAYNPQIPEYIQEKIAKKKLNFALEIIKNNGLKIIDSHGVLI